MAVGGSGRGAARASSTWATAVRRPSPPLLWVGTEGPGDPWPSAAAEPGPWWPRVVAPDLVPPHHLGIPANGLGEGRSPWEPA